jgi:hypothetical protein
MLIPMGARRMLGASSQQIQRVRQQRQNRRQGTPRPCRAARQVHDQRGSQCPAHCATQRSKRRMSQSLSAHPLRQSIDYSFTNQLRGLRRHIPCSHPGSTRGHNQICILRMAPQRRSNHIQFVGQYLCRHNAYPGILQQLADSRPGEVDLLPPRAAVADRQHNGANIGRKTLGHALSLRVSPTLSETSDPVIYSAKLSTKNEKIEGTMQTGARNRQLRSICYATFAPRTRQTL